MDKNVRVVNDLNYCRFIQIICKWNLFYMYLYKHMNSIYNDRIGAVAFNLIAKFNIASSISTILIWT